MENLGSRIRFAADKIGGLDALAKATGVKRTTMFDYAAGRTEPKISTVAGISRATGVSISWLAVGTSGELEKSPKVLTEGASLEIVRKFAWNIAATFWKEMPRRTKPEYVADQFVETLDFLLRRDEMNEDAASEVIHFGAERLKRRSER